MAFVQALVALIIAAIIALLGIYLFSYLAGNIEIEGSFAGLGQTVLIGSADALVLGVGGSGLVITALLFLIARTGR